MPVHQYMEQSSMETQCKKLFNHCGPSNKARIFEHLRNSEQRTDNNNARMMICRLRFHFLIFLSIKNFVQSSQLQNHIALLSPYTKSEMQKKDAEHMHAYPGLFWSYVYTNAATFYISYCFWFFSDLICELIEFTLKPNNFKPAEDHFIKVSNILNFGKEFYENRNQEPHFFHSDVSNDNCK